MKCISLSILMMLSFASNAFGEDNIIKDVGVTTAGSSTAAHMGNLVLQANNEIHKINGQISFIDQELKRFSQDFFIDTAKTQNASERVSAINKVIDESIKETKSMKEFMILQVGLVELEEKNMSRSSENTARRKHILTDLVEKREKQIQALELKREQLTQLAQRHGAAHNSLRLVKRMRGAVSAAGVAAAIGTGLYVNSALQKTKPKTELDPEPRPSDDESNNASEPQGGAPLIGQ